MATGPLVLRPGMGLERFFLAPPRPQTAPPPQLAPLPGGLPPLNTSAGSEPGVPAPSGFADAPAITNDSPMTLGGMLAQGLTTQGQTPNPYAGPAINTGLGLAGILAGIPSFAISAPVAALGILSQLGHRFGLQGQDTSGVISEPSGPVSFEAQGALDAGALGALAQGLGLNAAQLDAINQEAPFGRGGDEPAPPDPTFADIANSPDANIGGMGQAGPADPGEDSGIGVFRRGGTVKRTGPARVHQGEEVIRASEARRVRPALKQINRPGVSGLERLLMGAR